MRAHFHWITGEEKFSQFKCSPGKFRYFCSRCRTHLIAERSEHPHPILRVATLDDNPGVRPCFHIWTSHAAAWLEEGSNTPDLQNGNLSDNNPI